MNLRALTALLGLGVLAAISSRPVVADEPAVKIEFKVQGVRAECLDALHAALNSVEGVAEVAAGPRGIFQLVVAAGKSVHLHAIEEAIAGVDRELSLDLGSLALAGTVEITVEGVETAEDRALVEKAIASVEGLSVGTSKLVLANRLGEGGSR